MCLGRGDAEGVRSSVKTPHQVPLRGPPGVFFFYAPKSRKKNLLREDFQFDFFFFIYSMKFDHLERDPLQG